MTKDKRQTDHLGNELWGVPIKKTDTTAKDYCACCEYPELLHMMQPRIEELEKQVHKLSKKTCIDLDIIACIDYRLHELDNKVKELDEKLAKKLDAKTDI